MLHILILNYLVVKNISKSTRQAPIGSKILAYSMNLNKDAVNLSRRDHNATY